MKKIVIAAAIAALLGLCILLFWQHTGLAKERDMQARLTGTWTFEINDISRNTNVVTPDGRFNLAETLYIPQTNMFQVSGTWIAKNGHLIETIVSSTERRHVHLPSTNIYPILRLNERELVMLLPMKKSTNKIEMTWKKIAE